MRRIDVECPTCGAFQGQACVGVRYRPTGYPVAPHAARARLAREVAALAAAHLEEERP